MITVQADVLPSNHMFNTKEPTITITRGQIQEMRLKLCNQFSQENVGTMNFLNGLLNKIEGVG